MPDTNQRVKITKRMLREGLLTLLKEKPLDKVNITELCQKAGVNRTTFYRYYELPRDILLEMQSEFFGEIFRTFQKPLTADDVERFFLRLSEQSELAKLLFMHTPEADWLKIFNHIYQNIPTQTTNRVFQNPDENDARLLSAYLSGGTYFLARQWIMEDIPLSPKGVANIALNMLEKIGCSK
ncbi:MAG: TetR/AcrR family transcriptional regulator [Clostridium sp.]|nr:TetR/AcrR family transcriptional regulator [Acetatifactor muris]MCM1526952.1 TetR/AcrR family transcriptional regulator [Bacteroides sp.]MCM1563115.1 TetR/AcrR family transcriptional regulator [Clostridium sp.]